jgi:hypothetical protein
MVERAYRELEAVGYSRSTLRTLHLILDKAFREQVGRSLGAHKPRESGDERPVWTIAEAQRFGDLCPGRSPVPDVAAADGRRSTAR